jgi:hypothetical protein
VPRSEITQNNKGQGCLCNIEAEAGARIQLLIQRPDYAVETCAASTIA